MVSRVPAADARSPVQAAMKIVYLTPGCFDKGGISRYCRYQISALRDLVGAKNVSVFSLLGPDENSFEKPLRRDLVRGRTLGQIQAALLRARVGGGDGDAPDLVLCAHVNMSGWAHALARCVGARSLLNVYGMEVWSGFRRDASWGIRSVDDVISDCHFTARYIEGEGLRRRNSTGVIWDCVDLERFCPAAPRPEVLQRYGIPAPSEFVNLLTLGRIGHDAAHKGYERLLEVFIAIAAELPSLRLIFAGRGDLIPQLRERAAARGLADRVVFTGAIHESDLADVYRSAHIFSLVSDRGKGRGEGIPLTPLEAAACGVPIIVGNDDGSQEAVVADYNGFVVPPRDPLAHAEAIRVLARDADTRNRMAAGARERIEREFSYATFRDKHRAFLGRYQAGRTSRPEEKHD